MRDVLWRLPVLKQVRRSGWFNEKLRRGFGGYWGAFPTRQAALDFLPPSRRAVADDDEMATMNLESFSTVHMFDWPILFFLSQEAKAGEPLSVIDLGGHVGAKYHAFKSQMAFPTGSKWQIVDVPAVVRAGRQRITPDDAGLAYFERMEETHPSEILLCSGVVQYLDSSLENAIDALSTKPRLVLLNKVAVSDTGPFYTLESLGKGRIPYHVDTLAGLDAMRERLGYRRVARWDIPDRTFDVGSQTGMRSMTMVGEVWRLDDKA